MKMDENTYHLNLSPERKRTYLFRRQEDATNLLSALNTRDFPRIREIVHKVKGSARLFEYVELETRAKQIEDEAVDMNFPALERDIPEFATKVNALLSELPLH